jgi:small GTP-binding protein
LIPIEPNISPECLSSSPRVLTGHPFSQLYTPTVLDDGDLHVTIDGIDVAVVSTSGDEDYDRLRPLAYPDADAVLVCFALDKGAAAAASVTTRWMPEVRHLLPATPVILVGTRSDLGLSKESAERGRLLVWSVNAEAFVEISAANRTGMEDLRRALTATFDAKASARKWKMAYKMTHIV